MALLGHGLTAQAQPASPLHSARPEPALEAAQGPGDAWAEAAPLPFFGTEPEPPDARLLRVVYAAEAPAFEFWMRQVNASAYPAYAAAGPALAAGALVTGESLRPAARMVAAEAAALAATVALKRAARRPRPYTVLEGIASRDAGTARDPDRASFPSGHTSLAFAVATSASLSYPEWYVVAPAFAWAASMGLSRVWHGVHYPSDVLAGAVLGSAAAVATDRLLPERAPAAQAPLVLRVRVAL